MFPCVDGLDRDFLMEVRAIRGVWARGRIVWSVFVFARDQAAASQIATRRAGELAVLSITACPDQPVLTIAYEGASRRIRAPTGASGRYRLGPDIA